ncbi:MG2 domain-containing protein [Hymenobacter seoulensis]
MPSSISFMRLSFFHYHAVGALLIGLVSAQTVQAQSDSLQSLARRFTQYQQKTLQEKVFLHLDRPLYLSGETMWFKVYATDGTYAKPLPLSTVVYVEVLDKNQQAVLQGKIPLKNATGQGSFQLPSSLNSGSYTVRAYTSWMKNFSPEFYFHSPVTIVNTFRASGVVSTLDTSSYDVQFFPEGGHLVKGIPSRVAFKVTDKNGKGVAAEGTVLDTNGKPLSNFKTLRYGMGSFQLTPALDNYAYTAAVKLPNGRVVPSRLPLAQPQGYVMRLSDNKSEQLTISVQAGAGQTAPETIFLLGHARQQLSVQASAILTQGRAEFVINKKELPEGISHFTVFNASRQPVCERLYFVQPKQNLVINAKTDKLQYALRDKVSVQVATTTSSATVQPANLSMAVYRLDSLSAVANPSILSYLWLASDLKGAVENPDYYFTNASPEVAEATENLMLTHGWSRFRWEDMLSNKPLNFQYLPELRGHLIRGRITQKGTGKPAADIPAYLASPSRLVRLSNSISAADGSVQFEMSDFYGARDIVVQTNTQRDSTYQLEIFSPFSKQYAATTLSRPFMPYPRFKADFAQRHVQTQVQNAYFRKYNSLYTLPVTDSVAFFGKPDESYRLDDYTRFKVMEEVMREYVPGVKVRMKKDGFHFTVLDNPNRTIFTDPPLVLLDGVPVFNTNKIMAVDPLKIEKLEVLDSRYFQGRLMYSGIVSFTTYKGNLQGYEVDPRALIQEYEGVQLQREFFAPRYDTPQEKQNRLADQRNLLYWNPNVTTSNAARTLDFYTSDQAGTYFVVFQGLAANGLAGSTSLTFQVNQAL